MLLTPEEVAALLKVSTKALKYLHIPRVKLGYRTLRFRPEDVNAFLDRRSLKQGAA